MRTWSCGFLRLKVNYCLKIIERVSHLFKIIKRNMFFSKLMLEPIKTELMELEFHRNNLSMLVILMLKISAEGKSINKILMIHFKLTNNLLMQVKLDERRGATG